MHTHICIRRRRRRRRSVAPSERIAARRVLQYRREPVNLCREFVAARTKTRKKKLKKSYKDTPPIGNIFVHIRARDDNPPLTKRYRGPCRSERACRYDSEFYGFRLDLNTKRFNKKQKNNYKKKRKLFHYGRFSSSFVCFFRPPSATYRRASCKMLRHFCSSTTVYKNIRMCNVMPTFSILILWRVFYHFYCCACQRVYQQKSCLNQKTTSELFSEDVLI